MMLSDFIEMSKAGKAGNMTRIFLMVALVCQMVLLGIVYSKSRDSDAASTRYEGRISALRDRLEQSSQEFQSTMAELRQCMTAIDERLNRFGANRAEVAEQQDRIAQKVVDEKRFAAIAAVTGSIRSLPRGTEITVEFVNGDPGLTYDLYWIDFSGRPIRFKTLEPGEKYEQSTYVGDPWAFVDARGNALKRCYVPSGVTGQMVTLRANDYELVVPRSEVRYPGPVDQ